MARKATKDEISCWLGRHASSRMQSKTGCLIDALQARALSDARAIAAELAGDIELLGISETQSTISEVCDLLQSEAVFRNCDRLSYVLLDLEQKLSVMPSLVSGVEVAHKPARAVRGAAATLALQRAHGG